MRYRRSRLTLKKEKRTRNSIIVSIIGIVILLFVLFKFGTWALVNFSIFIGNVKSYQYTKSQTKEINFLVVPVLNPLPNATNSAIIIISGNYSLNQTINLYVNDKLEDSAQTKDDGTYSFEYVLSKGENAIKVNAENNNKKSDFSQISLVTYKDSPPLLEINSPTDGQNFSKDQNTVKVIGKTDSGVSITVNSFWAVIDENNNFSYNLPLQNGENQIKVVATDQAGNKSEKTIKINYSQ